MRRTPTQGDPWVLVHLTGEYLQLRYDHYWRLGFIGGLLVTNIFWTCIFIWWRAYYG